MDDSPGEPPRATTTQVVPLAEEVSHAVMDMRIDGAVGGHTRSVAEVCRPAAQKPVELISDLQPWCFVAGYQHVADLCLDPLDTLLGWAGAQILLAILPVMMRAERVTKELEALLPGIFERGLRLVQCQPELRHHRLCPRQRLRRAAAAEDDEVISVRNDVRSERFTASGEPPMLQEPIHVHVGQQRADNATLRRAARAALASGRASRSITIPVLDRR